LRNVDLHKRGSVVVTATGPRLAPLHLAGSCGARRGARRPLCLAAWNYGYATRPLSASGWRTALQTGTNWTLVITMALLAAALSFFWWPRRRQRLPIGLICVAVMVVVAQGAVYGAACSGPPPLALQLGQIDGLGATQIGALTVGSVLWRQPLDRLRSRFARDATIFTGLSLLTVPLLRQLAATQRNPGAIVVIEPDEHPQPVPARPGPPAAAGRADRRPAAR
jgi:hypothetical protein